jgi:hypothetical protein
LFENFKNIDYYAYDKDNVSIEYLNSLNNLIYKKKINYINKNQVFETKENFFDLIILILASIVPFGPFIIDKKYLKN